MLEGLADKLLVGGTGGLALVRSGFNPLKAMNSSLFNAAMFSSPTAAIEKRKQGKSRLLSAGKINPAVTGQAPMYKSSSMQKEAFWGGLKNGIRDVFTRPVTKQTLNSLGQVVTNETGRTIRAPWVAAGAVGLTTGTLMGLDYLQGQARVIDRARSYRNMMKEYGTEIRSIARETEAFVPDEEIQRAFNALYTVSPDIAKNPTLAAAQLAPIVREIGTIHGYTDDGQTQPRVMMEHGLEQFTLPSRLQGGVPKQKAVSDYVGLAGNTLKGIQSTMAMISPESKNLTLEQVLEQAKAQSYGRNQGEMMDPRRLERIRQEAESQSRGQTSGRFGFEGEREQELLNRARHIQEVQQDVAQSAAFDTAYEQNMGREESLRASFRHNSQEILNRERDLARVQEQEKAIARYQWDPEY